MVFSAYITGRAPAGYILISVIALETTVPGEVNVVFFLRA